VEQFFAHCVNAETISSLTESFLMLRQQLNFDSFSWPSKQMLSQRGTNFLTVPTTLARHQSYISSNVNHLELKLKPWQIYIKAQRTLLIPERRKMEVKQTLLVLHIGRIEAKRTLAIKD
jgi:hypothetical protein